MFVPHTAVSGGRSGSVNHGYSMVGVSEYFGAYEADYNRLIKAVNNSVSEIERTVNHGRSDEIDERYLWSILRDSQTKLRQMELEVQSLPNSSSYNNQVLRYRHDLRDTNSTLTRCEQQLQRSGVTGNSSVQQQTRDGYQQADGRQQYGSSGRLLDKTAALRESSRALEDSRRMATETEDLGMSIMGELRGQRDTIIRSTQMAAESNVNMNASGQLITRMRRRHFYNKVLLYGAIALLSTAILLVIYIKLTHK
eukprot:GHVQ01032053.1.p1 GENE.GHVQ01032053.1~~GHVQ01032053.1.p1  ORF type:complete len:253 (+),score=45.09 GHVQ01032053.1:488-1246(+)